MMSSSGTAERAPGFEGAAPAPDRRRPRLLGFLDLPGDETSRWRLLGLMLLAYLLVTLVRLVSAGSPEARWNGQLLLTNPDGYFFATEVKKALTGGDEPRRLSTQSPVLVGLAWLLARATPFRIDVITYYMPLVISGLVVIPMVLIGRLMGSALLGFFAAVQCGVAWAYYSRTLPGSFDTDMFALTYLLMLAYLAARTLTATGSEPALWAALLLGVAPYFYTSWEVIGQAIVVVTVACLAILRRSDPATPEALMAFSPALLDLPVPLRILATAGAYELTRLRKGRRRSQKVLAWAAVASSLALSGFSADARGHLSRYLSRGIASGGSALHLLRVEGTVQEAQPIPLPSLGIEVSGSMAVFAASALGMLVIGIRHGRLAPGLPLVGVGALALVAGQRFAMYLVPPAALGYFLLVFVLRSGMVRLRLGWVVLLVGSLAAIQPHVHQAIAARPRGVLNAYEAQILHELGEHSSPGDHVLAWWDYAYPIGYFSGRTSMLGGTPDNFILSKLLATTSQMQSARLARVAVERWASLQQAGEGASVMEALFGSRPESADVSSLLDPLGEESGPRPGKSREIFLYLPFRMLDIFPTVRSFSEIEPSMGEVLERPFFSSASYRKVGSRIDLGSGVIFDEEHRLLAIDDRAQAIQAFIRVSYDADLHVQVERQVVEPSARLSLIHLMSYRRILVVDESILNSVFFQLFFFERYDPEAFELVLKHPMAKVFRIKP